jgi:hypothetical protein
MPFISMKTDKASKHSQQNDKADVLMPLPVELAICKLGSDMASARNPLKSLEDARSPMGML